MKGIAYLRVSTALQELSPDAQIQKIRQFAAVHDVEIVDVYQDLAVSGRTPFEEREGGRAALAALETADVIIFAKLSRAFRNAADALTLVPKLIRSGKDAFFLDLGVSVKTPTGKMIMGMLAVQAEWEADIISERTKEALGAAVRSGKKIGKAPLGWRNAATYDAAGRKMNGGLHVSVPGEQELVCRILAMAGAMSYGETARRLNAEGVATPKGARWHPKTVRDVVLRSRRA